MSNHLHKEENRRPRLRTRVNESTKEEFRRICEDNDESMTDVLGRLVRKYIEENGGRKRRESQHYYPSDPGLRSLYQACLDAATPDLKIYQRRHASYIAEQSRQVKASNLPDALIPLRKQGFVARGFMPIDLFGEAYRRWLHWHVKPAEADPAVWTKREDIDQP